ncbi:MAG: preprotein translocase subunit SecE [Tissierellia bacterium]|nr:preprotein translocase subunit SecE [Tissierellia bacterium]
MTERKSKKGFFKGIKSEFKKIVWPTKKETITATSVVLAGLVVMSAIIKVIDVVLRFFLNLAV